MLQPSQIETVSLRFPMEIAEVREFLRGTGISVETAASLREVVRRLTEDSGFHRDLGSHVWMLLYSGASVPETLGVLAVAAAGPRFAAMADEDDAHALLRFAMESRDAMGGGGSAAFGARGVAATPAAPVVPTEPETLPGATPGPVPIRESRIVDQRPAAAYQPGTLRSITPAIAVEAPVTDDVALPVRAETGVAHDTASRRNLWLLVAACLLVFAAAGWWWMRRPSAQPATASQPAPIEDRPVVSPPVNEPAQPSAVVATEPVTAASHAGGTARPSTVIRAPHWSVLSPSARSSQPAKPSAWSANATPVATSAPAPYRAENASPAPVTRVAPPAYVRGTTPVLSSSTATPKAATGPVPSSVLAGRLGSPAVNQADAVDDRVAGTRGYPRLLRRNTQDAVLMAKATPMAVPDSRASAIPAGTVRSTSLGISAGNLVYAPDPAYPAAAASQHISGQVTVQAMVDREGNVASARVISGPPMLRDAAVNAVQQWRYRPFTTGGKPQTFTATAVMDFQLQ